MSKEPNYEKHSQDATYSDLLLPVESVKAWVCPGVMIEYVVGGAGDDAGVRAFKVSFVTEDDRIIITNSDQS